MKSSFGEGSRKVQWDKMRDDRPVNDDNDHGRMNDCKLSLVNNGACPPQRVVSAVKGKSLPSNDHGSVVAVE